ncbi:MAG TPA: hypothetical protein P5270_08500 [Victivallales bacterium]|nr:hypothetical protein [Victivallales bacterium]HPO90039.1 hypothetical protein [Victivallales bacterium]HRR29385.1 hypothetical protein [Victivallales bacterium]
MKFIRVKNYIYTLINIFTIIILSSSCNQKSYEVNIKPSRIATKFPVIKKYLAELDCVSPKRVFYNDEEIKLTFRLTNLSHERLVIYEWMKKQEDNIFIYYYTCPDDSPLPSSIKEWKVIKPDLQKYPPRQTLELANRNSVLIDKTFKISDFGLEAKNDFNHQFVAIIAALNLSSINLLSNPIKIEIRKRNPITKR